jgi:DNA-binding GntR family transcriptional regulator
VSRTPVLGALQELERQGVVEKRSQRGFFLARTVPPPAAPESLNDDALKELAELLHAVARARCAGALPQRFSVAELVDQFRTSRQLATKALAQLQSLGLVDVSRGAGVTLASPAALKKAMLESLAFRMALEPALLDWAPGEAPREWLSLMAARHEAVRARPWTERSVMDFNALNVDFHQQMASFADDRHGATAVREQMPVNSIGRAVALHDRDHIMACVSEHLDIIGALQESDRALAALHLRDHLGRARGRLALEADHDGADYVSGLPTRSAR